MLDALKQYINDQYGSRRGLVNHYKYLFQYKNGEFAQVIDIDWCKVNRFIFICHGNICRSPLAEVVARQRFSLNAESFGIDCTDGAAADPRAVAFANSVGLDLTQHRSRHIRNFQARAGDLIIGMEPAHLAQLTPISMQDASLTLVGLWAGVPRPYIHDPYSASAKYFTACERFVTDSVEGVAKQWSAAKR